MNPDAFWRHAMRQAYLTSIEQWGLRDVAVRYAHRSHDDSWWACDVELRPDGAGIVVPLTLARLESWAAEYDEAPLSPRCRAHFSMPPVPA